MAFYEFNPDDAIRFADFVHIKAKRTGDELVFQHCPFCGENSKEKNKFAINLKTGQYNCFRATCGAKGNMITLSKYFNFELPGYADEYYNSRKRYAKLPQTSRPQTTEPAIEYLQSRGISEAIARKYEITTDKQRPELLLFPFYDENNVLQLVKYRNTLATKENGLDKEWSLRDKKNDLSCKPILFGMNHCDPTAESGTLIMTEGQLDTLAVAEAGYRNVVSVPTGANGFTWVPYCWDFMKQFKQLIVFGDYEKGQITLLREMQRHFFFGPILHVRPENYKDCKDANDILRKYGTSQIRECIEHAVQVTNENFVKLSEIRPKSISEMENFKTGISSLDRILGGFYFGQLVILTGERGEGKSTLSNQFVLMAVNSDVKTFIYSGELPDGSLRDWIDCQAAGSAHMVEHRNSFGDADYTIEEGISDKIGEWYSDNLYIFQNKRLEDLEADDDIDVLELVKEATKEGFRMIVIDNLMTAMDDDPRYDLYRAQTRFVKQLSRIAKARDVLIVLIAHQRKNQGTVRSADDVSGSGNITNLADVVLMFGKPKDKDAEWPRELSVFKNRLTGRLGKPIPMWYEEGSRRTSDSQRFDWSFGWEQDFTEIGEVPNPFEEVDWDDESGS